jgi:hypothetical protein
MKTILLLAFILVFTVPSAAHAFDARAYLLRSQIEAFLQSQKQTAAKNNCKLETKGSVSVEKSSAGYYAFTLPHITYTDAKNVRTEIGMVAMNATPQDNGKWNVSMAVPTPMVSYDTKGAELFKTDIGTQNATGVWDEKLSRFTTVNADLSNIIFSNLMDKNSVSVNAVTFKSKLSEQDEGVYTGNATADIGTITLNDSRTGLKGVLEKIALATSLSARVVAGKPQPSAIDGVNVFSQLFGTPERIDGRIKGLDALSAQISTSMLSAKPEHRQSYLAAVLGIGGVAALGKPDPSDASTRYYDVVFGENGEVMLNGTDFGSILTAKK